MKRKIIPGWLCQFFAPPKYVETAQPQPDGVSVNGEQYYQIFGERADEDEDDLQNWDSDFIP